MNKQDFETVMQCGAMMCGRNKLEREKLRVYFEQFEHEPEKEFEQALSTLCKNSRWFPSVSDIKAELRNIRGHSTGALNAIKNDEKKYARAVNSIFETRRLPESIAVMSDERLTELFIIAGIPANHDFHIKQLRRGNTLWLEQIQEGLAKEIEHA